MKLPAAFASGWLLLALAVACAGCRTTRATSGPPAPVAISGLPTVDQVVLAVNTTTAQVRQLQTESANLTIQGLPRLRANIAMERPRRFRLRADFIGLGQLFDLGSNDELFWARIDGPQLPGAPQRALYFARHEQYSSSAAEDVLPVPPPALIEAFGLVHLETPMVLEGPIVRGPGQLEIRTQTTAPDGGSQGSRVLVLDDRYAWVLEHHWYDFGGRWMGSVIASRHRFDPDWQASLPHRLEVRLPAPQRSFEIDVESYAINQLYADPGQIWTMPACNDCPLVDLAAPRPSPLGYPPPTPSPLPATVVYPEARFRPTYRGYAPRR